MFKFIETSEHPEEPYVGAIMKHDDEEGTQNLSLVCVLKSIDAKERVGKDASELYKAMNAIDQRILNS